MQKLYFLLTGSFFTFVLFIGMTFLVKPSVKKVLPSENRVNYVPFKIDDKAPVVIKRILPEKDKIIKKPKSVRAVVTHSKPIKRTLMTERGLQLSTTGIKAFLSKQIGITPLNSSYGTGGGLQPSVRISPRYPVPAARDNIEGFVTLSFDISKIGKPINIQILEAKPKGYFEKSARRALKKWKFDPELIKKDVDLQQVTLVYELQADA